jgi:hypothetical protein
VRGAGVTGVKAVTLTPFHYHSLAVPSGTATLSTFLADRSMSYALAGAMGGLRPSVCLPEKGYLRDMRSMTWLCSAFEAENPRLLPPLGKRLNLDTEGGYQKRVMDATGTGNLKTWFYIQEVPQDVVYQGAIFGPDPFEMASRIEGRAVDEIIIRTGRHLGGILSLRRSDQVDQVRLNAHTAHLFGADVATDDRLKVDVFALYDIQLTRRLPLAEAAEIVSGWMH